MLTQNFMSVINGTRFGRYEIRSQPGAGGMAKCFWLRIRACILYLNRKCTGALVSVHPFGGFNMSGTDSKAGAVNLTLFMQAKASRTKMRVGGNAKEKRTAV